MSDEGQTVPVPPGARKARLTIVAGGETSNVPLPAAGSLSLGRSRSADVTIDDTSLSRVHGRLECGPTLRYVDLGSSNGSWIAGRRVEPNKEVEVRDGDLIEMGNAVVIVQRPGTSSDVPPDGTMDALRSRAKKAAKHRLNVLVLGETGVGKGVLAREIHAESPRREGPFVVVDCASLATDVIESELFGHEQGAFTGATQAKPGLLESADGGTVFLDEIGELPLPVQAKLLRVIEERTVRRVGGVSDRTIDVRFVAATHRALEEAAADGHFRTDLLYRLNAVTLRIPPLRERRTEIAGLARGFLEELGGASLSQTLTQDAVRWLEAQPWPGNIRELRNAVEGAVATMDGETLDAATLEQGAPTRRARAPAEQDERARIMEALERCAGNQTKAAELLGISRRTLIHRLDLYRLPRPRKRGQ